MLRLQTVICDLDGTLIDSEAMAFDIYLGLWKDLSSKPLPKNPYAFLAGKTAEERVQIIRSHSGCTDSLENLVALVDQRFEVAWNAHGMPVRPGVDRFLRMVRDAELRLGLATSSYRPYTDRVLAEKGWTDLFDIKVTREDAVNAKPAPDLYQKAIERLMTPISATIAIEDSLPGAMSAKNAGLNVLGVRHPLYLGELPATRVVTSLEPIQISDLEHLLTMSS